MRIQDDSGAVVVEDDYFQQEAIEAAIWQRMPGANIRNYSTAVSAIEAVESGRWDSGIRLIIVDRMLQWCEVDDPRINEEAPAGVDRGDAVVAAILARDVLRRVPLATLSINRGAPRDIRADSVTALGKSADLHELDAWLEAVVQ